MRLLLVALGIVAAIYIALIAAAWAWQERLVWQPPRLASYPVPDAQRLTFASADGQALHAWLVGDPSRARGLLVAFHGNAELASWSVPWAAEVERRTGWAVLLPEYRGYDGGPGTPGYAASGEDARATWRLARERLGATRLAYYGHSLGSAVATDLAAAHPPLALVLSAPFTSARDMARRLPLLPLSALWGVVGRVKFDTRAGVAAADVPVWVAHGERDVVVPTTMGREVYAAARRKGELLLVPGAGHNDLPDVGGAAYWRWLGAALTAAAPAR